MRVLSKLPMVAFAATLFLAFSCQQKAQDTTPQNVVSPEVLAKIKRLGFSTEGVINNNGSYIVERDIMLTEAQLDQGFNNPLLLRAGQEEQYRTTNVVNSNGSRVITVYIDTRFNSTYVNALNDAIGRYNALNLDISFQRVTSSSGADINVRRLNWFLEFFGVLGSAGFPTNGNPYNEILMNGRLQTSYGYNQAGIATVIAHEMGHCIGFRHTDYFDRSISCGGSTNDEGDGGVGAILIPGTPTGASLSAASWMLACSGGGDRQFNADDVTALNWMYKNNF
ncbi:protease B [marine bacterium AO1-C]|nr:protease B [marine bacterium AO1-C]